MSRPSIARAARPLVRLLTFWILSVLAGPGGSFASSAGPRAVVVDPEADLGVVAVGADVAHTFVIRNEGDAPLRLDAKGAPPGVTLSHLDREIAPGASGSIQLRLDTLALEAPELEVTVTTNDPDLPSIALRVKVLVRIFVGVTPGYARYNYVRHEREGTVTQVLWADDGADFRVVGVTSPLPHIRVRQREARPDERLPDQEGPQWAIDLTIAADSPVGPIDGTVTVETDHPRQRLVWIPVSGFVRPMFAVTPPALVLGDVAQAPAERVVRLHVKNFAEGTVELTSVTSDLPGITATLAPIESGRTYTLIVTVSPRLAPGAFAGTLTIHTASDKQRTVEVPVSGTVGGP